MPVPVDDATALVYQDRYVLNFWLAQRWERKPCAGLRYANRPMATGEPFSWQSSIRASWRHR